MRRDIEGRRRKDEGRCGSDGFIGWMVATCIVNSWPVCILDNQFNPLNPFNPLSMILRCPCMRVRIPPKIHLLRLQADRAPHRFDGRRSKDEGQRTKDEGRRTKDEGRRSKVEGREAILHCIALQLRKSKVKGQRSKVQGPAMQSSSKSKFNNQLVCQIPRLSKDTG